MIREPEAAVATPTRLDVADNPVAIEVRGVSKAFRIPDHRVESIKERALHPLRKVDYRTLQALRDVSFDVREGEFFGIVGRNGSGKSTLLKIIASIYGKDAGRVRIAGRVAPFIELGVGFDPELTARENAVLNGVLMGLTLRESRRRFDSVLDFAELRDFVDLKLKNYSSGMMVRLAFAVMVQADADVMLIDEVLAVGDAAFARKCLDVFQDRRRAGKTIVLVTHDMGTVQSLCHRAMLLEEGRMVQIGDPEDVALAYQRLNFTGQPDTRASTHAGVNQNAEMDVNARVLRARLHDGAGETVDNVEQGTPVHLETAFEARRRLRRPRFLLKVVNEDGVVVGGLSKDMQADAGVGETVELAGRIDTPLTPGRYFLDVWIVQPEEAEAVVVQGVRVLDFVVFGTDDQGGIVTLEGELSPRRADAGEGPR
jgi:ABC-type polysaccharide/polyol phosphate transport system ATPase subunit